MDANGGTQTDAEHDMYIGQLKEVFDSCDKTGSHCLDREELFLLCERLQLEDQSEYFVNELLKDKDEVDFEEFKESFVTILCQTFAAKVPTTDEEEGEEERSDEDVTDDEQEEEERDDDENDEEEDREPDKEDVSEDDEIQREVSPKYVVGNKRYGRRSLPFTSEDFECMADDEEDIDVASSTKSLKHSLTADDVTDTDED